jgi:hypothetical protein
MLVCSPTCTSRPKRGFFASLIAGPAVVPQTPDHHRTSNSFSQDLLDFMMAEANEGVVPVSLPSTPAATRQTVFPQANPMSALKRPPGSATERATPGEGGSPTRPQLRTVRGAGGGGTATSLDATGPRLVDGETEDDNVTAVATSLGAVKTTILVTPTRSRSTPDPSHLNSPDVRRTPGSSGTGPYI